MNDLHLGSLYILMAVMLLAGSLISRRGGFGSALTLMVAWITIFAAGFVVFSFRDDLGYVAQRLKSEATGTPVQVGKTLRIPMALDGHFWVEAEVNGVPVKFLIDSGATMTTVGAATAAETGLEPLGGRGQLVRTGNGVINVARARADTINLQGVERRDMTLFVAENDDINVLGMNWLSSLQRWGVEGRWLILEA
ncbi:TIGR02281 family clan AA aspartic protease [Sphingomonas sp. KRR8]|uniref:retropepsin-like aspartic protease family protein n=1 Tax=Sphingomonas sp. KRR8 TaxID=2942996 RepID=UPI0020226274|nr:TIGR02281 family clan AA aspartic protease [Sphingomonas sp. KRR8]URD61558.1 TIGR02281 family clan AA aspartic protease [Sphingomonas sp. KRR8]